MSKKLNRDEDTELLLIGSNKHGHDGNANRNQVRGRSIRNCSQALGKRWIATLIISFIVILGECALLLFIWIESARRIAKNPTTSLWMRISDPQYLTVIITVSAMALRVAIASQAVICGSLLAFLILKASRSPLSELPALLMIRAGRSSSPENIIMTLGFSNISTRFEWVAAAAMAIAVLGSQLTSTFLASDLKLVEIDGEPIFKNVSFGFRFGEGMARPLGLPEGEIMDPWTNKPSSYSAFAEYQEPPVTGENFIDTGLTMRAMLPFLDRKNREDLRSFSGPARLLEAQVVCVQPTARMNISLIYDLDRAARANPPKEPISAKYISRLSNGRLTISGEFKWKDPLPMLDLPEIPYHGEVEPTCIIPTPERSPSNSTSERSEDLVILCPVKPHKNDGYYWPPGLKSYIATPGEKNADDNGANCDSITSSAKLGNGLCRSSPIAFAVFRGDSKPDLWKEEFAKQMSKPRLGETNTSIFFPIREWSWNGTSPGAWATLNASESGPKLSASLCFTSNIMRSRHVHFKARQTSPKDATMMWDSTKRKWNVSGLTTLLVSQKARSSASSFELSPLGNWSQSLGLGELGDTTVSTGPFLLKNRTGSHWDDGGYEGNHVFQWTSQNGQVNLCTRCKTGSKKVHGAHIALFQEILSETSNLALAIQAIFTTILQMTYYEFLPQMTMDGPAQFTMSNSRTAPTRWAGLSIVLFLVSIHLTSVILVLWKFYAVEDDGLKFCVGEAWQAVKHANSGASEDLLKDLGDRKDADVREMLKGKGRERLVGIESGILGPEEALSTRDDEQSQIGEDSANEIEPDRSRLAQ